MYTLPERREKGIASNVLIELENWTKELDYIKCIREPGKTTRGSRTIQKERLQTYSKLQAVCKSRQQCVF